MQEQKSFYWPILLSIPLFFVIQRWNYVTFVFASFLDHKKYIHSKGEIHNINFEKKIHIPVLEFHTLTVGSIAKVTMCLQSVIKSSPDT